MDGTRASEIIVNILHDKVKHLLIGRDVWKIVNNCLACFVQRNVILGFVCRLPLPIWFVRIWNGTESWAWAQNFRHGFTPATIQEVTTAKRAAVSVATSRWRRVARLEANINTGIYLFTEWFVHPAVNERVITSTADSDPVENEKHRTVVSKDRGVGMKIRQNMV